MNYVTSLKEANEELKSTFKLRNLKPNEQDGLLRILSLNKAWLILSGFIRNPDNEKEYLYTAEDISIFENHKQPVECFWNDWTYRGKKQATMNNLLKYLHEAQLIRAASYVETELLKITSDAEYASKDFNTSHPTSDDISCGLSIDVHNFDNDLESSVLSDIKFFDFDFIQCVTQNFNNVSINDGGSKIGEGSYGTVFKAVISDVSVAIKKLKISIDKQFFTELQTLNKYKHENILSLIGCSVKGSKSCLIYKYMPNGSLQERLACCTNSSPIPSETRLSIAYGSASGITFLHTHGEKPIIHRDIKSANILLDEKYVPKIGDFGLARIGSSTATASFALTENICGTRMYMPIEAFSGDVSVKLDTYSFGVVLLELLTGLPPYDQNRDGIDLVSHMENFDEILMKLDPKVKWDNEKAIELNRIAKLCLTVAKKNRPALSKILPELKECCLSSFERNKSEIFV